MKRHDQTQLRVTPWPKIQLPHPPPQQQVRVVFDEEARAFVPDFDSDLLPAPQGNQELYLKLAAIDIDDIDDMLAFTNAYGELGVRQFGASDRDWEMLLGLWPGTDSVPELEDAYDHAIESPGVTTSSFETLVEWQWAIRYVRDLITAWRVLHEEITVARNEWQAPLWDYVPEPPYSPPWTPEGPGVLLEIGLLAGLHPFTPQVRKFWSGGEPYPLFKDEAVAWNVCCLELFNHIVEEADYKTCARDDCGRLYVRQEGRAKYGQHRTTGTKYCSRRCAGLVTTRNQRRRQRTKN